MDNTRQYGETILKIRSDHVQRYLFACDHITKGSRVVDIACGCGYGSWLLKKTGHEVTGVDIDKEAIEYAERHYKGPSYLCQKAEETTGEFDALVSFETLEHIHDPLCVLKAVKAPLVIASVPNEELYPFSAAIFAGDKYPHLRHYTPEEFERLLNEAGLKVKERFCQKDKRGEIFPGVDGSFLIYIARND